MMNRICVAARLTHIRIAARLSELARIEKMLAKTKDFRVPDQSEEVVYWGVLHKNWLTPQDYPKWITGFDGVER